MDSSRGTGKTHIVYCLLAALVMFAVASLLCLGCASPSDSGKSAGSGGSHSKEYYEGYWVCSGYKKSGTTVSFDNLSPKDKETFPYLSMVLKDGLLGSVVQTKNGSGEADTLLMGEWKATSNGIRIDDAEFVLSGESLTAQQGDTLLYFQKCIWGRDLHVGTIMFEEISFDAPFDLAYVHDSVNPGSSYYGAVNSLRGYGPGLSMISRQTEANDITDMVDYFAGYEDCFTNFHGMSFFVRHDKENHWSDVEFVANGKWYSIGFSYFPNDPVDYSDYAETFYTTIQIGGNSAGSEPSNASASSVAPSGAISWKDAPGHIGERVTVYGPVLATNYASGSNGQPTYIDIGAAYPDENRVSVVVWGEDRGAFPQPPETMYENKTVRVTGEIYEYNGVCNIKITSPNQIEII